jgi:hypothetical protein
VSCRFAADDGAYVLGALGPAERLEFERHLGGCADCSQQVRDLAGLTGLLAKVPPDVLAEPTATAVPAVPATVLPALVAEVHRTQRRRWSIVAAVVAAAAVVAVGASAVVLSGDGPASLPPDHRASPSAGAPTGPDATAGETARARPMQVVGSTTMTAEVSLTAVAWGTRLDLTCGYPGREEPYGDGDGRAYSLVVRTRDGATEEVATWHALPGQTMQLTGATSIDADDIAAVQVRGGDGSPVLRLRA